MQTLLQKKIKLFPLFLSKSGCDYHRVKLPYLFGAQYIDDDPYKGFSEQKMLEFMGISELLVYNRNFPLGLERLQKIREKSDMKVVVDLDDYWKLPDYHPNYYQYKNSAAREIIENLKAADCVTVTTDRLYNRVKEYNKNVHVIPNALPFGYSQFTHQPEREENQNFNFIYTGQSSHLEDVRIMQADIKRASRLWFISFTVAGYKSGGLAGKVWYGIETVFNQGAPYTRIDALSLERYMTVYDNADCSLVPLCLNDFNSCKSNLKILEAACKKIPCIVSWVPPYRDDADAPVLWVKSPGEWYQHIKFLSENRDYAKEMGEQLYEWAKERFDLIKWNRVRFELYQSLIN